MYVLLSDNTQLVGTSTSILNWRYAHADAGLEHDRPTCSYHHCSRFPFFCIRGCGCLFMLLSARAEPVVGAVCPPHHHDLNHPVPRLQPGFHSGKCYSNTASSWGCTKGVSTIYIIIIQLKMPGLFLCCCTVPGISLMIVDAILLFAVQYLPNKNVVQQGH